LVIRFRYHLAMSMKPLKLKHARRPITIHRDEAGVPHIKADSRRSALYGLGYMHAVDRTTQMLFARAVASGLTAERIADKPELLETDRLFRRAGLYENVKREVESLDDETFGHMTAYCLGVNDGIKDSGRSLPMWATGFRPQPWNQESVLLIGNLLSFGGLAIGQQQQERLILELIHAGVDDDRMREMFAPRLDDCDFDLLRRINVSRQLSDQTLELITDLPRLAGSNAWAVSPQRSATGSALLASDPHLEINRLPAIWYEAVLSWDDHYVMGATLPGCPLFAVARNEHLAWGVTYAKGDTSDFFVEDCRRGGETGWQYRRGRQWHDFQLREETIKRKDHDAEVLKVYSSDAGTIEADLDAGNGGLYLAVNWTGHGEGSGRSIGTWLDVAASTSTRDAMDVARECPQPALVWVFADREGHIGRQVCGWYPVRRSPYTGLTPIPAWIKRNHWRGHVPSSKLPCVYDPPEGFVASANEDFNPPGGPMFVTLPQPDYRIRRINERLAELPAATVEEMQQLQYDVVSLQARDLLKIFLPHLPDGEMKRRLSEWDCRYNPEGTEATLFGRLYRQVLLEVFGQSSRDGGIGWRRMLYLCTRVGFSTMITVSLDRLMHRDESLWWQHRDKGEMIRYAAKQVESEPDVLWSEANAFRFTNRFFGQRRVGRVLGFHTGEMAMPGCHATPFQGQILRSATRETTFAPSYHFVTDLGNDDAWTNLPGGASESRFSSFYKNGIPLWLSGKYKRLAVDAVDGS
jgi:penicillin amidase